MKGESKDFEQRTVDNNRAGARWINLRDRMGLFSIK